jgi:hypothetical protein
MAERRKMANFNKYELESFAKRAADAYLRESKPLNDSITKMASDMGLNQDQVQRIVENSNILVNGTLVKRARLEKSDPRITFERASGSVVKEAMDASGDRAMAKQAQAGREFASMFKVAEAKVDNEALLDKVIGPMTPSHYGTQSVEVDPNDLAIDYVGGQGLAKSAEAISTHSIKLACDRLEAVMIKAREKRAHVLFAAEKTGADLKDEIRNHLASGVTPATLRDVVKHAGIDGYMQQIADIMISDVAKIAELREGDSTIGEYTLVNTDHPILAGLRKLSEAKGELDEARSVEQKVASGWRTARNDLTRVASRGRP